MTGTRLISLEGCTNFRDVGGYRTTDGRTTRWGQVFRSDSLHALSDDDLTVLDRLGVEIVYDLRRAEEVEEHPGRRRYVHVEIPSQRVRDFDRSVVTTRADGERWLHADYLGMLAAAGPVFGDLLTRLAAPDAPPSVFHCYSGKDRTGMLAALLLSALGVDRETVLDDYELTDTCRGAEHVPHVVDHFVSLGIAREAACGMLGTARWAMADALRELDERYGGIDAYLTREGHMTGESLDRLRARLTA